MADLHTTWHVDLNVKRLDCRACTSSPNACVRTHTHAHTRRGQLLACGWHPDLARTRPSLAVPCHYAKSLIVPQSKECGKRSQPDPPSCFPGPVPFHMPGVAVSSCHPCHQRHLMQSKCAICVYVYTRLAVLSDYPALAPSSSLRCL